MTRFVGWATTVQNAIGPPPRRTAVRLPVDFLHLLTDELLIFRSRGSSRSWRRIGRRSGADICSSAIGTSTRVDSRTGTGAIDTSTSINSSTRAGPIHPDTGIEPGSSIDAGAIVPSAVVVPSAGAAVAARIIGVAATIVTAIRITIAGTSATTATTTRLSFRSHHRDASQSRTDTSNC